MTPADESPVEEAEAAEAPAPTPKRKKAAPSVLSRLTKPMEYREVSVLGETYKVRGLLNSELRLFNEWIYPEVPMKRNPRSGKMEEDFEDAAFKAEVKRRAGLQFHGLMVLGVQGLYDELPGADLGEKVDALGDYDMPRIVIKTLGEAVDGMTTNAEAAANFTGGNGSPDAQG